MAYYLGIDGGGTKTRCVLGDETNLLATAASGGANIVRVGDALARESLHTVIRQACAIAKISLPEIHSICIGASGAGRSESATRIRAIVSELDPQFSASRIRIVGDSVIALEAAFGSGPGVIAIAGTGSIVFGRDATGHSARAGGWGFAISDEGSGHWIGRQAVSAVLRAHDQNDETLLYARILEAWKLPDMDALILRANSTPPPEFPRLFPIVLRAAEDGDRVAHELLIRAGTELAALAQIVLERISPTRPHAPLAMTGSVFRQSADVRHVFYNRLEACFPGIEICKDFVDPVMGALALARAAEPGKTS
ncbi:MAG: BadF/BadG/BcrA/BcrD ATPase family protein [Terriglobales bacterium]